MKIMSFKWVLGFLGYVLLIYMLTVYRDGLRFDYFGCCTPLERVEENKDVITDYVVLLVGTILISLLYYLMTKRKTLTLITLMVPAVIFFFLILEIINLNKNVVDFESHIWKEKRPVEMAIDIRDNLDLIGKSRADVIQLLGDPDDHKIKRDFEEYYYHTSYENSVGHNTKSNMNCVTLFILFWKDEVDTVRLDCAGD